MRKGKAVSHGAVTIVNALASGKGAAMGVGLRTIAEVEVGDEDGPVEVRIDGEPMEDSQLSVCCVRKALRLVGLGGRSAKVMTRSEIPIAKGLKSSSAAANAVILAALSALGVNLDDLGVIEMGVDGALEAGVTITGAFDDACASYFGGVVVTDNYARKIVRAERAADDLIVVIYVTNEKSYTKDVEVSRLKPLGSVINEAFSLAAQGKYWEAMTINGFVYASALGYSTQPLLKALENGALGVGLSGKGPAIAAICHRSDAPAVQESWRELSGQVLLVPVSNEKAADVEWSRSG